MVGDKTHENIISEAAEARESQSAEVAFPGKGAPSLFANQFYVIVGPAISRLSLGEMVYNETPNFHSSFTIPTSVAKEMAETILRIIAEQTPNWEATNKPSEAGQK